MPKGKTRTFLNPGEAAALKAAVYDLSEFSAKQMLYGIIQILSHESRTTVKQFKEILDDARAYSKIK